jgi:hypothetical protein
MDRLLQLPWGASGLVKEGKAHRIMRISDRKSGGTMEQMPRRRDEGFKKNQRGDSSGPEEFIVVIQPLSSPSDGSGEKGLVIARCFSMHVKPLSEGTQGMSNALVQLACSGSRH